MSLSYYEYDQYHYNLLFRSFRPEFAIDAEAAKLSLGFDVFVDFSSDSMMTDDD